MLTTSNDGLDVAVLLQNEFLIQLFCQFFLICDTDFCNERSMLLRPLISMDWRIGAGILMSVSKLAAAVAVAWFTRNERSSNGLLRSRCYGAKSLSANQCLFYDQIIELEQGAVLRWARRWWSLRWPRANRCTTSAMRIAHVLHILRIQNRNWNYLWKRVNFLYPRHDGNINRQKNSSSSQTTKWAYKMHNAQQYGNQTSIQTAFFCSASYVCLGDAHGMRMNHFRSINTATQLLFSIFSHMVRCTCTYI